MGSPKFYDTGPAMHHDEQETTPLPAGHLRLQAFGSDDQFVCRCSGAVSNGVCRYVGSAASCSDVVITASLADSVQLCTTIDSV